MWANNLTFILHQSVSDLQDPVLTAGLVEGGEPVIWGVAVHPRTQEVRVMMADPGHLHKWKTRSCLLIGHNTWITSTSLPVCSLSHHETLSLICLSVAIPVLFVFIFLLFGWRKLLAPTVLVIMISQATKEYPDLIRNQIRTLHSTVGLRSGKIRRRCTLIWLRTGL